MSIVIKTGFPISLLPNGVKSSGFVRPTEMLNVLDDSNQCRSHYLFIDVIMRRFNFPFFPYVYGNRVKVLLYKDRHKKSYFTEELREPDVSQGNVKFIQHMFESRYTVDTYHNIIYMIFAKMFKLNKNNFAIYGRDHNGNFGYLSFTNNKFAMFHQIT
jgi:hypothetical protein